MTVIQRHGSQRVSPGAKIPKDRRRRQTFPQGSRSFEKLQRIRHTGLQSLSSFLSNPTPAGLPTLAKRKQSRSASFAGTRDM